MNVKREQLIVVVRILNVASTVTHAIYVELSSSHWCKCLPGEMDKAIARYSSSKSTHYNGKAFLDSVSKLHKE